MMSLLANESKFDFDPGLKKVGIEMFAIVNSFGRIIHSEKFESLQLEHDKMEMFLMGFSLQHSMLKDFDDEFGPVHYTVTERNGRKFFSAPLRDNNIILVVTKIWTSNKQVIRHLEDLRHQFTSGEERR